MGHCRYRSDATGTPTTVARRDESRAACMVWLSLGCSDWRETCRHLHRLRQRAHELVRAELYPIHRLAEALRERHELAGERAEQILAAARAELAAAPVGSFPAPVSSR